MSLVNAGFNSYTQPTQVKFSGDNTRTSSFSDEKADSFTGKPASIKNASLLLGLDLVLVAGLIYLFGGKEAFTKFLPKLENSCVGKIASQYLITPAKTCWKNFISLFSKAEAAAAVKTTETVVANAGEKAAEGAAQVINHAHDFHI